MNSRKSLFWTGLVCLLLFLNLHFALAHQWENYRWFGDNEITVNILNYQEPASRALYRWEHGTVLTLPEVQESADIVVYGKNFGPVPWAGLATLQLSYHCRCQSRCQITSAVARYNSYYEQYYQENDIQGVFCHEIGHTLGVGHYELGNCMKHQVTIGGDNFPEEHGKQDINRIYQ